MDPAQWIEFIDFDRLPYAAVTVVLGLALVYVLNRFFDDLAENFTSRRLLFKKVALLSRWAVYLAMTVLVAVNLLVLDRAAIFAVAGSLALAFGFAFKDVLTSVTGGVFLVVDAPFQVGDRISFAGHYGEVIKIGLRSVRLVTLDDNLVSIPNSKFLTEPVASANSGALDCMVVVPFYIGAAEDFKLARGIIREATVTSRYVYLEKPVVTLVSDEFLGERFVTVIRVKAYVFDVRYEKAFASDVTERVKEAFVAEGIRTPDRQYRDLDLNQGSETTTDEPSSA